MIIWCWASLPPIHIKVLLPYFSQLAKVFSQGKYEGNSIRKLQIQVATYVFELSAGNCHR
jgi:hypothetical protein